MILPGPRPEPSRAKSSEGAPGAESDLTLVRRALEREPAAVESLLQRLGCVRRFLRHRNRLAGRPLDDNDLEDVTQDTLIAVWTKLDRFEGYGSLETWCYRFCVLELRGRIRTRVRRSADDRELPDLPQEESEAPGGDELAQVYQGLERLGPPASHVIRAKLLEDLTFDQIADRMDSSPNTVRAWYYRGLRKLRNLVEVERAQGAGRHR